MNFNVTKKLVFAAILVLLSQNSSFAVDDVWGGMGISDDSIQYNNDYANTVFEKYTTPSNNQTPDISTKQYPTNLSTINKLIINKNAINIFVLGSSLCIKDSPGIY